jgi:hypothetical protein
MVMAITTSIHLTDISLSLLVASSSKLSVSVNAFHLWPTSLCNSLRCNYELVTVLVRTFTILMIVLPFCHDINDFNIFCTLHSNAYEVVEVGTMAAVYYPSQHVRNARPRIAFHP